MDFCFPKRTLSWYSWTLLDTFPTMCFIELIFKHCKHKLSSIFYLIIKSPLRKIVSSLYCMSKTSISRVSWLRQKPDILFWISWSGKVILNEEHLSIVSIKNRIVFKRKVFGHRMWFTYSSVDLFRYWEQKTLGRKP